MNNPTLYTNTPLSGDFDGFEIHPVAVVGKTITDDGQVHYDLEPCDSKDAQMWSVYAHLVRGGLECIADFDTEQEAESYIRLLSSIIKHFRPS